MSKILVWLSGGVDSAVAAYLLREAGHEVECGFMINYLSETDDCPTRVDMEEARLVAECLRLPFHTFDFRDEYDRRIVEYIYEGYRKGLTPNPDVLCNNLVKFDVFLKEALEYGFDAIATGHYARIKKAENCVEVAPLTRGDERSEGGLIHSTDIVWDNTLNSIPYNPNLTELAQQNRKNPTPFEKKIWYDVLKNGELAKYKFTRQKPILDYIVDFYCSELQLAIEVDGDGHTENVYYDQLRSERFSKFGIRVLRFSNREVWENIEGVYDSILSFVKINPPSRILGTPPLSGGQGSNIASYVDQLTPRSSTTPLVRGAYHLLKWLDPEKDQSYFLSRLDQFQLAHAMFPIGHLPKSQVREIARRAGLPNTERKDSQGLCFIGKVSMKEFLEKRLPKQTGNILDTSGKIVGQHEWAWSYTIGQRRGIQVGGGPALFVIAKDIASNTITVGTELELQLYSNKLSAIDWHWIGESREIPFRAKAKIRYRQEDQDIECVALALKRVEIRFDQPQRAITSGQIVVVYEGDEVVGSGVIE